MSALRDLPKLGISVEEFLKTFSGIITATSPEPANREITTGPLPDGIVPVSREDVQWVVRRYLRGRLNGVELSNWAGLLLAVGSFDIGSHPGGDDSHDEQLLELLTDLAVPLKEDYLDRHVLQTRLATLFGDNAEAVDNGPGQGEGLPKKSPRNMHGE